MDELDARVEAVEDVKRSHTRKKLEPSLSGNFKNEAVPHPPRGSMRMVDPSMIESRIDDLELLVNNKFQKLHKVSVILNISYRKF